MPEKDNTEIKAKAITEDTVKLNRVVRLAKDYIGYSYILRRALVRLVPTYSAEELDSFIDETSKMVKEQIYTNTKEIDPDDPRDQDKLFSDLIDGIYNRTLKK